MGCIHIYTGDGKGKTTAAMGLALRSAGCGKRVLVTQFLKGGDTGELHALERLGIPVLRNSRQYGFFHTLSPADREALYREQTEQLEQICRAALHSSYDLIVLDESIGAYQLGALDRSRLEAFLQGGPYGPELVLTGRNAPDWMIERADYVTQMKKQKHPFDRGVQARRGIEY